MTGWSGQRGTSTERGYGSRWRRIRSVVLEVIDGYPTKLCEACEAQGRVKVSQECDHIIPKKKADSRDFIEKSGERMHVDDFRNLQALCRACHAAKTTREGAEAQGRRVVQIRRVGLDGYPIDD